MSEVVPQQIHPEAWAIDVDRTLVDVDVCIEILQAAYDSERDTYGLPVLKLKDLQTSAESSLESYSPYATICKYTEEGDAMPAEAAKRIFEAFIAFGRGDERIVYPDTREFLTHLISNEIPFYLNTRGVEFEWQRLKVAAAKLGALPIAITVEKDKGAELFRNRFEDTENGAYYAPQTITAQDKNFQQRHFDLAARRIIGLDDYKSSLRNWPSDCPAYWLDRPEARNTPKQLSQKAVVLPPNVQTIESLTELIK